MLSSEQIASILTALPDPVFILTRSGRYAAAFGGADVRYYHDGSSLIGKYIRDVLNEEKTSWILREIAKALDTRVLHVLEYGLSGDDFNGPAREGPQQQIWFEGRVQALDFPVDGEDAVLWLASNITARYQLESQLRVLSETDAMTGLFNRRKLMVALTNNYDMYVRYGTQTAVLIFDIDYFKNINDHYGHLFGDKAIIATGSVCSAELRDTDMAARFGGDEFVVLMPHTNCEQAAPIAERLRLRVAQELQAMGILGESATISGGLSEFSLADKNCENVLKRADDAMYQAKHAGRNRIEKN
jgi:diguanylate cyclase (GGDEF)-like protein